MLAQDLIEYIVKNNKLLYLLEQIGCKNISTRPNQKDYRCALPDGDNPTGVSVMKDNLHVQIYTRGLKGNIFTLVEHIYNINFVESLKKIHSILKIDYNFQSKPNVIDALEIYRKAKGGTYTNYEGKDGYDLSYLNQFLNIPHKSFVESGISQSGWDRFSLRYDAIRSSVIIPWFDIDPGKKPIAGIVRRTTIPNAEDFGIPKYRCENDFMKGNHLFGLAQNYQDILQCGYVVVFESERATIQRGSRLDYACVSIGSHDMKEEQQKILISLGVEIIIAYDKDIDEEFVRSVCKPLAQARRVSYILDTNNLLGENDSPADKGESVYRYLLENRKEYINEY